MSCCGEVNEEDWCSFHACMRNMCRWQHEETYAQREARLAETRTQLAAARKAQLNHQHTA